MGETHQRNPQHEPAITPITKTAFHPHSPKKTGNVYGYAAGPGGHVFPAGYLSELVKTGGQHSFKKLSTLTNGTTGGQPAGMYVNADGATRYGIETRAKSRDGTLFSFAGGVYTTLCEFDQTVGTLLADGRLLSAASVVNAAGTVFGPTGYGGDKKCSYSGKPPPYACGAIYQAAP